MIMLRQARKDDIADEISGYVDQNEERKEAEKKSKMYIVKKEKNVNFVIFFLHFFQ